MCEGTHWNLESRRENLMQCFGEEDVMGVDKSSERFLGLVRSQRKRAKVILDVLTLVPTTSHKWRVEEG